MTNLGSLINLALDSKGKTALENPYRQRVPAPAPNKKCPADQNLNTLTCYTLRIDPPTHPSIINPLSVQDRMRAGFYPSCYGSERWGTPAHHRALIVTKVQLFSVIFYYLVHMKKITLQPNHNSPSTQHYKDSLKNYRIFQKLWKYRLRHPFNHSVLLLLQWEGGYLCFINFNLLQFSH